MTQQPPAKSTLQEAVAVGVATGLPRLQIARLYGLTVSALAQLIRTPDMQALIREKKETLEAGPRYARAKGVLGAMSAIDNVIRIANTEGHKKEYEANTYLVNTFIPELAPRQSLHVHIDPGILKAVADGMAEMRRVRETIDVTPMEEDPHLIEGKDAKFYALPEGERDVSRRNSD